MQRTTYYFEFQDPKRDFYLTLPYRTNLQQKLMIPEWARLTYNQCPYCSLSAEEIEHCPPAYDMIDLVEHFSQFNSYDVVKLYVWTNSEMHKITTDLQKALSFLFPVIVANSSCPYATMLSPAMKFGKLFINIEDAAFFALSMCLVTNYLHENQEHKTESKREPQVDWAYTLSLIFNGLLSRIRKSSISDANTNAIVKNIQWSYVIQNSELFLKNLLKKYFPVHFKVPLNGITSVKREYAQNLIEFRR